MLVKKCYMILKPINLFYRQSQNKYKYDYDELEIKVEGIYLFGLILIYKKQTTISIKQFQHSYSRPRIQKLK